MIEYLQQMVDMALRKELQGIHFWATVYVLFVLAGSLWHVLHVRSWPITRGRLIRLGIRQFGASELSPANQAYVPDALYTYEVGGQVYQGREISVWKMSASGILKDSAALLPRQVQADESGVVRVYYNARRPHKSLLLRPGWVSLTFLWGLIALVAGFYIWRW